MKLLFENWRKYLKEDAGTAVAKKGARRRTPEEEADRKRRETSWLKTLGVTKDDTIKTLPADLMPVLYKVLVGDKETFSKVHEKYDIDELKNKSYEEIKYDKQYRDLIEEMLREPVEMLKQIGHYGQIKKGEYKDFFDFVLKLPEHQRIHVLTALSVYSDKWTAADAVGLLAFGIDQIIIYGCLFRERNPGAFKVEPKDYEHCRSLKEEVSNG